MFLKSPASNGAYQLRKPEFAPEQTLFHYLVKLGAP